MGARSEALAKQVEAKAEEALAALQRLSEADWKKVTAPEKWSVGVTAHHVGGAFGVVADVVRGIVAGRSLAGFGFDRMDAQNAQHARDHADCTRAETIELYRKGMVTAAAAIRELDDAQLAKTGTLLTGMPPMSAEQVITLGLLHHVDEHFGSIRQAVGPA
jgi:hypothetical protein